VRYEFQAYDGADQREEKDHPPEADRFLKEKDTGEYRSDRPDTRPDGIGCTQGQRLRRFHEEKHADCQAKKEPAHPECGGSTGGFPGFPEAGSKPDLKQAGDDQYDPVHGKSARFRGVLVMWYKGPEKEAGSILQMIKTKVTDSSGQIW
jgi:hypothetical protein